MSKKLYWYPLIVERFLSETMYMTLEETGAYIRLILYLFHEQRSIKDENHMAKILGINPRTSRRIWPQLRPNFVRNQHGFSHELVSKILKNNGKIIGLGSVGNRGGDDGGFSTQGKAKSKGYNPPPISP
ncbi:MAG: YdaU family protein, partial [Candidatus Thiodiazotropha sp. (ex Notomyrtea botanica)]|nr:YdaU family protein [Candidatus Thiodiazotropha sp. (ex Notomyrtea botanica)]